MNFVKSLVFAFSIVLSTTALAVPKHCAARIVHDISYSSFAHYEVDCGSEKIKTGRVTTSFLLPLPYNWEAAAKKKLSEAMNKRNMLEVAKIKADSLKNNMIGKNLVVYSALKVPHAIYALVTKSNERTIGLNNQRKVWDIRVEYSSNRFETQIFQGLDQNEINDFLKRERFTKTNVEGLFINL
jgi:hypothetical protein